MPVRNYYEMMQSVISGAIPLLMQRFVITCMLQGKFEKASNIIEDDIKEYMQVQRETFTNEDIENIMKFSIDLDASHFAELELLVCILEQNQQFLKSN